MDRMKTTEIRTNETFTNLFPIKAEVLSKIEEHIRENRFLISHPLDLAKWGDLKEPVCIDGHTRLQAAKNLGLEEVPVITHELDSEDEALELAIHLQQNRRNITDAEIFACVQALDKRHQRGGDRRSDEAKSKPQVCGIGESRSASAKHTADVVGISTRKVEQIRTITDHGEWDILDSVKNGEMSINKGYEETQKKRKTSEAKKVAGNGEATEASKQSAEALEKNSRPAEQLISLAEVCELFGEEAVRLAEENKIPLATDEHGNWIKNEAGEPLFHPLCKEIAQIDGILACILEAYDDYSAAHEPKIEWTEINTAFAIYLLKTFYLMVPEFTEHKDMWPTIGEKERLLGKLNTDVLERVDDYDFSLEESDEDDI
jgi:ParB-like chromosome segregation protein Spo0J